MSDILIRGMEMPQSCASCPFEVFGDCYGGKVKRIMDVDNYTSERAPRCPLHELPPHGELIDKQTALAALYSDYAYAAMDVIKKEAPVIVPADSPGEGISEQMIRDAVEKLRAHKAPVRRIEITPELFNELKKRKHVLSIPESEANRIFAIPVKIKEDGPPGFHFSVHSEESEETS